MHMCVDAHVYVCASADDLKVGYSLNLKIIGYGTSRNFKQVLINPMDEFKLFGSITVIYIQSK